MPTFTSKLARRLFIAELVVGLVPVAVVLTVGVFLAFGQILLLLVSPDARQNPGGSVVVLVLASGGVLGMVAAVNLVRSILYPGHTVAKNRSTLFFGLVGVAVLVYLIVDSDTVAWRIFFLIPLVVLIHVLYLGRGRWNVLSR